MLEQVSETQPLGNSLGPLRRAGMNERVNVWIGSCGGEEAAAALAAYEQLPRTGRRFTVLCPEGDLSASGLARMVSRWGRLADVLVVAGEAAATVADTAADAPDPDCRSPRVLFEADLERAVAGTLQWLRADDTLCLLGPGPEAGRLLRAAIALGGRWRGAWDEAENGEFHSFPR